MATPTMPHDTAHVSAEAAIAHKLCLGCGLVKQSSDFYPGKRIRRDGSRGLFAQCKKCVTSGNVARKRAKRPPKPPRPDTKLCRRCGSVKSLDEFYLTPRVRKDGSRKPMSRCKPCARAISGATYHSKLIKPKPKRSRAELNAAQRVRRAANPEAFRKRARAHYANNADKIKTDVKIYAAANPDIVRVGRRNRKARVKGAVGSHTSEDIADIRRMQKDKCASPACRIRLHGKGHVDHIVSLKNGGSNDRKNLQLLCGPCNMHKAATDQIVFMQRQGFLL